MLSKEIPYDRQRFNRLPTIETADADIRAANILVRALDAIGPVFLKHGIADSWALALLHNHWELEGDEIPVQTIAETQVPREYETSPRGGDFRGTVWPSILAVTSCKHRPMQALEFSTDPEIEEANRVLASHTKFVQDFCQMIHSNDWENTFGLVALREVANGFGLVESNYLERQSVLRETRHGDIERTKLIQTAWRFAVGAERTCTSSCFSTCTVPSKPGGKHTHNHAKAHKPG